MATIDNDGNISAGITVMPMDLHLAVRETYRRAITAGQKQREAFHLVIALVLDRQPQPLRSARRAAAEMLANEPYLLVGMPPRDPGTDRSAA